MELGMALVLGVESQKPGGYGKATRGQLLHRCVLLTLGLVPEVLPPGVVEVVADLGGLELDVQGHRPAIGIGREAGPTGRKLEGAGCPLHGSQRKREVTVPEGRTAARVPPAEETLIGSRDPIHVGAELVIATVIDALERAHEGMEAHGDVRLRNGVALRTALRKADRSVRGEPATELVRVGTAVGA